MPCDSSHMESTGLERELCRVLLLLEEVRTGVPVNPDSPDWGGYTKGVYGGADLRKRCDEATAELCSQMQTLNPRVFSPELQIWWRDHQKADRAKDH